MEKVVGFNITLNAVTYIVCEHLEAVELLKNKAKKLEEKIYDKLQKECNRFVNVSCRVDNLKSKTYGIEINIVGYHEIMVKCQTERQLRIWCRYDIIPHMYDAIEKILPPVCAQDLQDDVSFEFYNVHSRHEDLRKNKVVIN